MVLSGRLEADRDAENRWPSPEGLASPSALGGFPPGVPYEPGIENAPVGLPSAGLAKLAPTRLSILLPALNEERGVVDVIDRIPHQMLTRSGLLPSVYLLDGRSTDRTRLFASRLGAKVVVQTGDGKGAAFREFIPRIEEELIIFLDSDGTYPPEVIPRFVEKLREGHPVVLGSRLSGSIDDGAMSVLNYIGNRALSWFASVLYGTPISDVCTGMWAFSTAHLKSLDLTAHGFELEADLFAECALKGIPIVEIPIPYSKRLGEGKLRARVAVQIALALLKKRLRPRRQKDGHVVPRDLVPPVGEKGQGS